MWFSNKEKIKKELSLKRALPVGVEEFHSWSDRIIAGAMLPATHDSQKFALANMLINNLGPTIAFETDVYFIHALRKTAINQVADAMRVEIRDKAKARLEAEQKMSEVTTVGTDDGKILDIRKV